MVTPRLKSVPAQQIIPEELTAYHLQDSDAKTFSRITYTVFGVLGSTATGVNDANDNPVQWTYSLVEIVKTAIGYGGWSVKPGGFSTSEGYNSMENTNTGVGRQGTGIDHDGDNYPTTYQMQPLQTNSIWSGVIIAFDRYWDTIDNSELIREGWVFGVNAEDGTCS